MPLPISDAIQYDLSKWNRLGGEQTLVDPGFSTKSDTYANRDPAYASGAIRDAFSSRNDPIASKLRVMQDLLLAYQYKTGKKLSEKDQDAFLANYYRQLTDELMHKELVNDKLLRQQTIQY